MLRREVCSRKGFTLRLEVVWFGKLRTVSAQMAAAVHYGAEGDTRGEFQHGFLDRRQQMIGEVQVTGGVLLRVASGNGQVVVIV